MKSSECCPSGVRSATLKKPAFAFDRIVCDDNLVYMRSLWDGCCDLIYADPPFNSNRRVGPTKRHLATFNDRHGEGVRGFLGFLQPRVIEMSVVVACWVSLRTPGLADGALREGNARRSVRPGSLSE